jgi:thioredoxin 1
MFPNGRLTDQAADVRAVADHPAGLLGLPRVRQVVSGNVEIPARWRVHSRERAERGRFPGSVPAEQAENFTGSDSQVQPVDRFHLPVSDDDIAGFNLAGHGAVHSDVIGVPSSWAPDTPGAARADITVSDLRAFDPIEGNPRMPTRSSSTSTFDTDVIARSHTVPVVVDFWAEWCGPCRAIAPVLEDISDEQAGVIDVVKVNSDENPALVDRYGITGIPAILVFQDGEPVKQIVGAKPKRMLLSDLSAFLRPLR